MGVSGRNVRPASGGDSKLWLALQTRWGVPVTTFAGFIQRNFPFIELGLDLDGNFIQSESTFGDGTAPPDTLAGLTPSGPARTEVLPEDIVHFLRWIMNIQTDPVNAAVTTFKELTDQEEREQTRHEKIIGGTTEILASQAIGTSPFVWAPGEGSVDADAGTFRWPAQVAIELDTDNSAAAGAMAIVRGTRATGRSSNEFGEFTRAISDGDLDSTLTIQSDFFRTVSEIRVEGVTGGNIQIDTETSSQQVGRMEDMSGTPTFVPGMELGSLSAGLVAMTIQAAKGSTPVVAQNATVGNATLTMGQNVNLALDLQASNVINNVLATDITARAEVIPTTISEGFRYVNQNFARGFGTAVNFGDVGGTIEGVDLSKVVTTDNVVLGINNNLEEPTGNTGDPTAGQPLIGDAGRQITLQIDKSFEVGADSYDWQSIFRNSSGLPIIVNLFIPSSDGRIVRIVFRLPNCTLSESPRVTSQGRGTINQTLNFNCSSTDTDPAITAYIVSEFGFSNDTTA